MCPLLRWEALKMAGVCAARFIKSEALGRDFFVAAAFLVGEVLVGWADFFFGVVAGDFRDADSLVVAEDFLAAAVFLGADREVTAFLVAVFLLVLADFLAEADFFLVMGVKLLNR